MNEYGQMAVEHFRRWRPEQFQAIADTAGTIGYFTRLGEEVAAEIAERAQHMAAEEAPRLSADYQTRAGQLNVIRRDVREAVLVERVLLPPEDGVVAAEDALADEPDDEPDEESGSAARREGAGGEPEDPAFEEWKAETLAALAGDRLHPRDLPAEDLTRLREATDNPRLLELAGIRDEDLRALGLM